MRKYLKLGYLNKSDKIIDYGCGKGKDVETLRGLGYNCIGYDPYVPYGSFNIPKGSFDIILLTYVINVISSQNELMTLLTNVFNLCKQNSMIMIASRSNLDIDTETKKNHWKKYNDGWVTMKNTFQRGYKKKELKMLFRNFSSWDIPISNKTSCIGVLYKKHGQRGMEND